MAAMFAATAAIAQVGPGEIWGMIYNLVAPTLTDKQTTTWQSTSNGHLSVTGLTPGSCTNKLDFTQACNSQYIGVL